MPVIEVTTWMEQFLKILQKTFNERIWFVGLQGSYARGEATEHSDIDIVVILDELNPQDIQSYHTILDLLPHRELVCGFLSGKAEILHWEPSDLFQFYHDTKPIHGSLDDVLPLIDPAAVDRAIQIGACNIYHGCVHNMLYEKSEDILRGLYKSASFVMQAICFRQTGNYIRQQRDLLSCMAAEDRKIVETFLRLKQGDSIDLQSMSESLFLWAKNRITKAN
jgi:predicted nucleotidyltransferase